MMINNNRKHIIKYFNLLFLKVMLSIKYLKFLTVIFGFRISSICFDKLSANSQICEDISELANF